MKALKVGVIGLGRQGLYHAVNVRQTLGAQLTAICDIDDEKLSSALDTFGNGVNIYKEYKELLLDPNVEAVIISTSTRTHFEIIMQALELKKSIFVEKPMTYKLEEAEIVHNIVKTSNLYLQVGFMRRFDEGHIFAKKNIDQGQIGCPFFVVSFHRDSNGPPPHYVSESGGLFLDMGIHNYDSLRWLMGTEVTEVFAQGAVLKFDYLRDLSDVDHGQVMLKFENGGLGMIELSRNGSDIHDARTKIVGAKGTLMIGVNQQTPYAKVNNGIFIDLPDWARQRFDKAYRKELQVFINSVKEGKSSPVSSYDGLMAIKVGEAVKESFENSKVVKL